MLLNVSNLKPFYTRETSPQTVWMGREGLDSHFIWCLPNISVSEEDLNQLRAPAQRQERSGSAGPAWCLQSSITSSALDPVNMAVVQKQTVFSVFCSFFLKK